MLVSGARMPTWSSEEQQVSNGGRAEVSSLEDFYDMSAYRRSHLLSWQVAEDVAILGAIPRPTLALWPLKGQVLTLDPGRPPVASCCKHKPRVCCIATVAAGAPAVAGAAASAVAKGAAKPPTAHCVRTQDTHSAPSSGGAKGTPQARHWRRFAAALPPTLLRVPSGPTHDYLYHKLGIFFTTRDTHKALSQCCLTDD